MVTDALVAANRQGKLIITIIVVVFLFPILLGCEMSRREANVGASERLARSIDENLVCPVCPGETIDQSQVALARQMKELVRAKISAGESRDEILNYFVDRYGLAVLAEPKKSGSTLVVWLLPPLVFCLGLLLILKVIRKMMTSPRHMYDEADIENDGDMSRILDIVDSRLRGEKSVEEEKS